MYMRVLPGLPPAAGISVYSKEKNTYIFLFSTQQNTCFSIKKVEIYMLDWYKCIV